MSRHNRSIGQKDYIPFPFLEKRNNIKIGVYEEYRINTTVNVSQFCVLQSFFPR